MGAATEVEVPIENPTSKDNVEMVESGSTSSQEIGYDAKATSKLIRKIDWVLLPFLALLYLLSFLDRTNIGNARLAGLEKDLGMTGLDYNVSDIVSGHARPWFADCVPDCSCGVLPLLRGSRTNLQFDVKEDTTFTLDPLNHGGVGGLHHTHGSSTQLRRPPCGSCCSWYCGGWFVPR